MKAALRVLNRVMIRIKTHNNYAQGAVGKQVLLGKLKIKQCRLDIVKVSD